MNDNLRFETERAFEAARFIVEVYGRGCRDRELLVNAIVRLITVGVRCAVNEHIREQLRPSPN